MTRSVGFLFLLLSLLSTSWLETASAFVITSSQGSGLCQPVRVATNPSMAQDYVVALKMSMEESSNSPSVSSEVSENTTPPKPPVKCPDCDLCDGSGRYVTFLAGTHGIMHFSVCVVRLYELIYRHNVKYYVTTLTELKEVLVSF